MNHLVRKQRHSFIRLENNIVSSNSKKFTINDLFDKEKETWQNNYRTVGWFDSKIVRSSRGGKI